MKIHLQTGLKEPSEMMEMFSTFITILFTLFAKTHIFNVFENSPPTNISILINVPGDRECGHIRKGNKV